MTERLSHPRGCRCHGLRKIRHVKRGVLDPVAASVVLRAIDQDPVALDAHHTPRDLGKRQSEITKTAKQIEHCGVRRQAQQLDGPGDQGLVDGGVDLQEVGWRELQLEPELRQPVEQRRFAVAQWAHAVQALGLQIEANPAGLGKLLELVHVFSRWRLQHAQHQRRGIVRDGNLDLRDPLANTETP